MKNSLLTKLINEALEEMAFVNTNSAVKDDDNTDIDSLLFGDTEEEKNTNDDDVLDLSDWEGGNDINSKGKKQNRGGLTGADGYTKGMAAYKKGIKDRTSANFVNQLTNPAVKDLFLAPGVKNPHNKFKRDINNADQFGRVKVQYSIRSATNTYKDGDISIISLFNIDPVDVHAMCVHFCKTRNTEWAKTAATRENHGKDGITFIVYLKNIDKWKAEELPEIIEFLSNAKDKSGKPKYGNEEQMQNLEIMLNNRIYSEEKIENDFYQSEKNNLERFAEYLSSEDDETINAIIDLYSRFNVLDALCRDLKLPESYGHILSWRNALKIRGYRGNGQQPLTFILPERTWKEQFGRVLKPGAKPITVTIPNTKNWNGKWKNPTPISYPVYDKKAGKTVSVEFKSTEDILDFFYEGRPYDQLSKQQQFFVNTLANKLNAKKTFRIDEFDISDTVYEPSLGIPDRWEEEVGLENNLTGALNQRAKDELKQLELKKREREESGENKNEPSLAEKDAEIDRMLKRTQMALENVTDFAKSKKIHIPNEPNESLRLINLLLTIAEAHIPEEIGITKHNFVKELAENAVYFVCRLEKIALDYINSFRHAQKVDSNTLSTFSSIVDRLIYAIESPGKNKQAYKTALEENIEMNDDVALGDFINKKSLVRNKVEDFLKKISQEAKQEEARQINENFYHILKRMDDSKKNLL